ncbi:MAG: penicillin-binding protein 2 [Planctomycetes bacterium]|nr:penicillin-binding protein 2 [Planctomycetota bacterium]
MVKKRFHIFFGIILVLFLVLFSRLFYLQMMEGGKYSGISNRKRIRTVGIDTLRGTIYDRNGGILAVDKHSFDLTVSYNKLYNAYLCFENNISPKLSKNRSLTISPSLCKECHPDNKVWINRIAELLEIPYSDIFQQTIQTVEKVKAVKSAVEKKNKQKVHIREETVSHAIFSNIAWENLARLEVEIPQIKGIEVDVTPMRWYPKNDLVPHVIGYVGKLDKKELGEYTFKKRWFDRLSEKDGSELEYFMQKALTADSLVGKNGIEKSFNSNLMGIPGKRFEEITLDTLQVDKTILEQPPVPGDSLYLTIDSKIQGIAEKVLGKKRGSIVVMDPWNGEVLAMATSPRFNLNTFRKHYTRISKNPLKPFLNRPIQSALPPGSIFKIITAIAALEENCLEKETQINCNGSVKLGNTRFRCHSRYGHGLLNIEEALQYSCNVFFFEISKKLGGALLNKWADKFGFGSVTGIELPYEKKGNLPKPSSMYEVMNLSIGQGALLVTPVQITRMMAMIANGGWYIKPHIVKKITDDQDNVLQDNDLTLNDRLNISAQTLDHVKHSLRKVVTDGTAKGVGFGELGVAGKTGTAETARKNKNHAWFCGYAPFENPKYCFTVVIEHTPGHGADAAGTLALKLLAELSHGNS